MEAAKVASKLVTQATLSDRNRCRSKNPRSRHGFWGFFMPFPRCKINRCQSHFSPQGREMNLSPTILGQIFRRFREESAPFFVAKFVK